VEMVYRFVPYIKEVVEQLVMEALLQYQVPKILYVHSFDEQEQDHLQINLVEQWHRLLVEEYVQLLLVLCPYQNEQ